MEQLIGFVREAAGIVDPAILADRALAVGMAVFPSDLGQIYLRHPGGAPLEARRTAGRGEFAAAEKEAFEELIKGVLRKARPVFLESEREGGLQALALPLRRGHEVIGALVLGGYGPLGDSLSAQDDAEVLCEQLGQVLARATGNGTTVRPRLLDHETFEQCAQNALAACASDGRHAAFLLVRVDGEGLERVASPLVETFRPSDVVGRRDDRTLEILTISDEPKTVVSVAERIHRLVPSAARASIGAALYPQHADYFESLAEGAAAALERARAGSEPCLCLFEEEPRPLGLVDPELDALLLSHAGRRALVMTCQMLGAGRGRPGALREAIRLVARATQADGAMVAAPGRILAARGAPSAGEQAVARAFARRALQAGRAVFERDAIGRGRLNVTPEVQVEGILSVICVPVGALGRAAAAFYLDRRTGGRPFSDDDLRVAELFLGRVEPLLVRGPARGEDGLAYAEAQARFEREYLGRVLAAADGSLSAAARAAGLSRNGLKAKLRRLGIRGPRA